MRSERKIFAVDGKDIFFCPTAISLELVTPFSAFETGRLPFETRSLPYARRAWQSFKFAPFLFFFVNVESWATAHG